jgi:peptidoglycan/LPS O-acetylase OafA/YrhL
MQAESTMDRSRLVVNPPTIATLGQLGGEEIRNGDSIANKVESQDNPHQQFGNSATSDRPKRPIYYQSIDALRGLAILGVVAVHTIEIAPPRSEFLTSLSQSGTRGVQLFFVVSAVTLFLSISSRFNREIHPYRNFFIRRFFRIAPLFYCAILLFPLLKGVGPSYFAPEGIKWWHFLTTATFCNGWTPESITSIVPGGWSIAVEMTFYLLLPLLFMVLTNLRRALLFLVFTLVVRVAANALAASFWRGHYNAEHAHIIGDFTYFWIFNQLPVFSIGIVTYHLFRTSSGTQSRFLGALLLAASVSSYLAISFWGTEWTLAPIHIVQSLSFSCLAVGLTLYPTVAIVNTFMCWVGKLSYSIYITHFVVIGAASRLLQYFVGNHRPIESDLQFLLAFSAFLLIAAMVSTITYRMIELPGMACGNWLIRCLESPGKSLTDLRSLLQVATSNNDS